MSIAGFDAASPLFYLVHKPRILQNIIRIWPARARLPTSTTAVCGRLAALARPLSARSTAGQAWAGGFKHTRYGAHKCPIQAL
jgi:hypothetical protein